MKKTTLLASLLGGLMMPAAAQNSSDKDVSRDYQTDEVVITGTRNATDIRHLPMTITTLNRQLLIKDNRTSVLPTLSEQVPGLFVTSRGILGYAVSDGGSGSMSLRGISASSGRMMVLIDGHPQYMGIFGHPVADVYQTFLADKVEVLRGPASLLYGSNAMGGVVNIVTRKMQDDGVNTNVNVGYGSYNTLQTEATNRVRSGRFSSVVSASYNRTDGHRSNMAFEQFGGYGKVGYELGSNWRAYADINMTHFKTHNPGTVSNPIADATQWITRGAASAALENHYDKTSGALSLFANWGHHKINDGYSPSGGGSPQTAYYLSNDALMGFSLYQSVQLFHGNRITAGIDFQHITGHAWNRSIATRETTNTYADKSENEVAGYVDFRQDIASWLTLDAGLRLDHHSQAGTEWVPQAGLSFRLPQDAQVKAMVSKGFRFPNLREMYMFPPQNDALKAERLWNYELSYTQRLLDSRLVYGVNVFYLKGDNMIQTQRIDGRPRNVNTGEIENWGVELNGTYRINDVWTANANYSALHMENHVVAAPESKLYGGVSYSHGRWAFNTGVQWVSGLFTAVGDNEQKESFVLWNADVNYRVSSVLTLYAKGENLLAQKYEINAGFPMPKATFMGGVNVSF